MGISNALMHTSAAMQAINMVLKLICACVSCYAAIVLTPTLKEAVEALGREHKRVIQMQERSEEAHIGVSQHSRLQVLNKPFEPKPLHSLIASFPLTQSE